MRSPARRIARTVAAVLLAAPALVLAGLLPRLPPDREMKGSGGEEERVSRRRPAVPPGTLAAARSGAAGVVGEVAGADSPGRVVFSHATHVDERRPDCTTCHPRLFPIGRATAPGMRVRVTHRDMDAGRQCGACHNGREARGREDCAGCHREE